MVDAEPGSDPRDSGLRDSGPQGRDEIDDGLAEFFAGSSAAESSPDSKLSVQPPKINSNYRIIRCIGEGGMGAVFLAEQVHPVRRQVAVKLIKPGMDTKEILARFETERQALAVMEHDNIARVYDAASTEDGYPYFVMEYVRGATLTEYCNHHQLSVRERLELFQKVCAGVQHAHQKGVLHRDLKPSNILVTDQGGSATPKIIDFGLARAIEPESGGQTILTIWGQFLGTPQYVSPEQAAGQPLDVDTRTDVYSLGVILYELLVGELPFSKREFIDAGLHEQRRMILEQDPPMPSSRLTTQTAKVDPRVTPWGNDTRALMSVVRGDLDWITMKALEKSPPRRYSTPEALAQDISRHLKHEPVEAGPPTGIYRFKKFVRRNRGPVLTAALVWVALIVGLATTLWQYGEATASGVRLSQESRRSRALGLAYASAETMRTEPMLALLLAQAAARAELRPEVIEQLHHAIQASPARALLSDPEHSIRTAALSPDAQRVLTTSDDAVARIWSVEGKVLARLEGHKAPLTCGTFSPSGRHAVTGSEDGSAIVWSLDGTVVRKLPHASAVRILAYGPAGDSRLLTAAGRSAFLWDEEGEQTAQLEHGEEVEGAEFASRNGDVILTFGDDKAQVWDAHGKRRSTTSRDWHIERASLSPDGMRLLVCPRTGRPEILGAWDGVGWDILFKGDARKNAKYVLSAAFSPVSDRILYTAVPKTQIIHYRSSRGYMPVVRDGPYVIVFTTGYGLWSPDGQSILIRAGHRSPHGELHGSVSVIDRGGAILATLHDNVIHASFSRSGDRVLTVSEDGTAGIWDPRGTEVQSVATGQLNRNGPIEVIFSPDGEEFITAVQADPRTAQEGDPRLRIWSLSGQALADFQFEAPVSSVAWGAAGRSLIVRTSDDVLHLTDVSGKVSRKLEGISKYILSPDRLTILVNQPGTHDLRLLSATGLEILTLPHADPVTDFGFSSGGDLILTQTRRSDRVWSRSGESIGQFGDPNRWIWTTKLSPSGQYVALSETTRRRRGFETRLLSSSGAIRTTIPGLFRSFAPREEVLVVGKGLYDFDGQCLAMVGEIDSVAFAHNIPRFVTRGKDVAIWTTNGKRITKLEGGTQDAWFSPTDDCVLTSRSDHLGILLDGASIVEHPSAELWNLEGMRIGRFGLAVEGKRAPNPVFSPSGKYLLVPSSDGKIAIYLVRSTDLMELARSRTLRDFTATERAKYRDLLDKD